MFNAIKRTTMKKKTQNMSVSYDPVTVSKNAVINFTRLTNAGGTTIYGKVMKNEVEVGNIAYDSKGGYLTTSLKPFDALTQEEVKAVYTQVSTCISEILSEE